MMKNTRTLFLCRKRYDNYGISIGLVNSANFVVNALKQHRIEAELRLVIDGNGIDREVHNYKPGLVVLEALWVTPGKLEELARLYPKVQWVVRIHSRTAFLANEGVAILWLKQYAELGSKYANIHIATNHQKTSQELGQVVHAPVAYLPNIYSPTALPKVRGVSAGGIMNIGCFGAIRPLKNQLAQAVAAVRFGDITGKAVYFHINANRVEQRGESVLKNMRALFSGNPHKLIEHAWLEHSDFLYLVSAMDIMMQVSLSESFNIVAADAVMMGVPVVVSPEIGWIPHIFHADPASSDSMVTSLQLVDLLPRWLTVGACRMSLAWYNSANTHSWLRYIYETT